MQIITTVVVTFVFFGNALFKTGGSAFFTDISMTLMGRYRGGPAKIAIMASSLFGTISGSVVANVVTTGVVTIPLMKRAGFRPQLAGAVEAVASTGGQLMPPVMGAVAFIMAETLNIPYLEVCKAAVVPALLYYSTVFWMVHLEAGRARLMGIPRDECPSAWNAIRRQWYLLVPLVGLVFMLFDGYTPMFAGMTGLALTAVLILGANITASIGPWAFRVFFWTALGLAASTVSTLGITPVIGMIAVLAAANLRVAGGRETLRVMRTSLIDGARQALPVGLACAIVGIVIGVLTLTGAASTFAGFVLRVGSTSLFLSLVLTMIVCLVLGMGIPTIPNYIITSSIAAPALLQLGVPLIVSHMFVFYFGIMADLTPPVALAALAASSIAKAPYMKIGFKATQIAIAGFVVPYMAVYDPSLVLLGSWGDASYVIGKALLAIGLWGAAAVGYLSVPLGRPERVVAVAAAILLVVALPATDAIAFALAAMFGLYHIATSRAQRAELVS
jgi:TRAP transporter 4TM/12TM fusion protein